jgi:hypothetical protein
MDSSAPAGPVPGYSIYRTTIALVLVLAAAILGFLFSSPAASPTDEPLASSHHHCVVAQADLHALELGGRVYVVDESGQRSFRDETDRATAIDAANARIARHCR